MERGQARATCLQDSLVRSKPFLATDKPLGAILSLSGLGGLAGLVGFVER